ncbi:MAG: flagellar export chaperone FliS [Lacunisphaera sp.]|nr:flagellar export chaperone FliS [Lacunisphaera sp.]
MLAQNYARTYRSNSVLTASPGQLVLMLYDGALKALGQAGEAFNRPPEDYRRIATINEQLLKAQNIIGELQGTLNLEAGDGQLAREMDRLYDYYIPKLMEANMRKEPGPVKEVERLLRDLRDGWAEMLHKHDSPRNESVRSVA